MKNELNKIIQRIYIEGYLEFPNSLHIGSGRSNIETNATHFRDVAQSIMIPGTSIAGSIKNHLLRSKLFNDDVINELFGYNFKISGKTIKTKSSIYFEDLYPQKDTNSTTIRDGNAIRRDYNSTRKGAKYDYEITPRESMFSMKFMVNFRDKDENIAEKKKIIRYCLQEFIEGNIYIGGNKTRGLGKCFLCNDETFKIQIYKFPEELSTLLLKKQKTCNTIDEIYNSQVDSTNNDLEISITSQIINPLLIKDGMRSGVDKYVDYIDKNNHEHKKETDNYFVKIKEIKDSDKHVISDERVIPGGSLKGIIRSRAEKILRTLNNNVCDPTDPQHSCSIEIKKMLNRNPQIKKKVGSARYKEVEKISCSICKMFGNGYLASKTIFSDAKISGFKTKKFDNVAINRFTSGPVESALFTSMPAIKGEFKWCIKIKNPDNEEIVLMMFVLKDLINSLNPISIGYGKTKGFGVVETDESSVLINGKCYTDYIDMNKEIFAEWKNKRGKNA